MDVSVLAVVLAVAAVGLGAAGVFLVAQGWAARRQITQALVAEHASAPSAPAGGSGGGGDAAAPEPIRDARTARARAEQIRRHTHEEVGSFQQTGPDSPERQWFLNGLTIRTALHLAIMGYGVANLAMATGAGMLLTAIALASAGLGLALR
jgi:hypothetical protein